MKLRDKMNDPNFSETDMNKLLHKFSEKKFDQELTKKWSDQLADKYGLNRDQSSMGDNKKIMAKKPIRRQIPWRIIAIAASFLLVLSLLLNPFQQPSNIQQLSGNYLDRPFENVIFRSPDMGLEYELLQAYFDGDYVQAVHSGEAARQEKTLSTNGQFYLGLSYLYTRAYPEAVQEFEQLYQLSGQSDFALQEETQWFLNLARIKALDYLAAEQGLEEINKGAWHYREAQHLMKMLSDLTHESD